MNHAVTVVTDRCSNCLVTTSVHVSLLCTNLLYFLHFQKNANVDTVMSKMKQPQIVAIGDLFDIDLLYIVVEGEILFEIPRQSMLNALLGSLACFYIFNITYTHAKSMLLFLEQALLGIGRGPLPISVRSFITEVSKL